ncbi:DUF1028 domain-containing protein [Martelella alba]|uniref:DUF1028 domain-containing protein n=1 Tax=Martelella alba TaxID=2590451 RepID=A0ABY2SK89_9HYPH|nr:DUF1028 domain-containing protein [Martelella alba]TKI05192.1 DUF1028 domain-containing protein [Martelella alba]
MTFSLAGFCPQSGQFGIALSSSSMAVAARCPWLMSGVGAVSSQNVTLPSLGPAILARLAAGMDAAQALDAAMADDPYAEWRQVTVIGRNGDGAAFQGAHTLGIHAVARRKGCIAAGNMLADAGVPAAMAETFAGLASQSLGDRLIAALQAGLAAGGEAGPVFSAGVKIIGAQSWPVTDLRVDWREQDAIGELARLWQRWQPESDAYLQRALNPSAAPRYGVPGEE